MGPDLRGAAPELPPPNSAPTVEGLGLPTVFSDALSPSLAIRKGRQTAHRPCTPLVWPKTEHNRAGAGARRSRPASAHTGRVLNYVSGELGLTEEEEQQRKQEGGGHKGSSREGSMGWGEESSSGGVPVWQGCTPSSTPSPTYILRCNPAGLAPSKTQND